MVRSKVTKQLLPRQLVEIPSSNTLLTAYRDGRKLACFADLAGLGASYLSRVVEGLEAVSDTLAFETARTRALATKTLLRFLEHAAGPIAESVRAALRANRAGELAPDIAHVLELAFFDTLKGRYRSGSSTLAAKIHSTNSALSLLASRGLWPNTLRIPPTRIDLDQKNVRPSLLEALGALTVRTKDLRGPVARENAALHGLQRLGHSVPRCETDLSEALLGGERESLERLRSKTRTTFDQSYVAWVAMQPEIASAHQRCDSNLATWFTQAVALTPEKPRDPLFKRLTGTLFPATMIGLSNFLALLELVYMRGAQSIYNSVDLLLRPWISRKLRDVSYRVGPALAELNLPRENDLETIRGLLTPSQLTTGSVAVLLMLETGMNTSPLISLPWDQVLKTDDSEWISIANWKKRARGTLIEEELEISRPGSPTSAGAALIKLREMATRHGSFVGSTSDALPLTFSHAEGHAGENTSPSLKMMTSATFIQFFNWVCIAEFGSRPLPSPSAIRPSILMIMRGHGPSVRSAQVAASHKSQETTFRNYTGPARATNRIDHMHAIRAYQEGLEQVAIYNLQVPEKLSNANHSPELLQKALKTGLGTLCLRPVITGESDPAAGCVSLEECPGCSKVRVSIEPSDLADLLAFGDHLAKHQDWLQTHRLEAWMTRWLFWSLLIDEVQSRGARSQWAANLKKAREIHASRPKPNFPPLW